MRGVGCVLNRELNYSQYFANRILTKSLPPRMYSLKNKNKKKPNCYQKSKLNPYRTNTNFQKY